jgi:hypothetical protein
MAAINRRRQGAFPSWLNIGSFHLTGKSSIGVKLP